MKTQLELLPRKRVVLLSGESGPPFTTSAGKARVACIAQLVCTIEGEVIPLTEWTVTNQPPCDGWWQVWVDGWGHSNMMFWSDAFQAFNHPDAATVRMNGMTVHWRGLTKPPRCGYDYDVPKYHPEPRVRRQLLEAV